MTVEGGGARSRLERLPSMMRRAFSQLRNGRRGPVMLETPMDLAREDVDEAALDAYVPPKSFLSAAGADEVDAAARALVEAQRPVILAGQGVLYAEAWEELAELYTAEVARETDPAARAQRSRQLGRITLNRLRRPEEARKHFEAVLEHAPDDDEALNTLEQIFNQTQEWPALLGIHRRRAKRMTW